jgi:hypothetical protein
MKTTKTESDLTPLQCDTCEYWEPPYNPIARYGISPDNPDGLCRRHTPVVVYNNGDFPVTFWPRTLKRDWCGEWKECKR